MARAWRTMLRACILPVLIVITASTFYSFHPGPLGFLVAFGTLAFLVVWWLARICFVLASLWQGRWKLLTVQSTILAVSFPLAFISSLTGNYLHLLIMYPYYQSVIMSDPDHDVKPIRFSWGDAAVSVLDGAQFESLIYDKNPENIAILGETTRKSDGFTFRVFTRHLIGDFYLELAEIP